RSKFEAARRTGARFVDLRPVWSKLEPRPGVYDWTTLDAGLANAEAAGLPVTILLRFFDDQIPAWLAEESMLDQDGRGFYGYQKEKARALSYWAPKGRKAYLHLIEAMVRRYRGKPASLAWQFFYGYNDSYYLGMWQGKETIYDYSKFSQEKYRDYLARVKGLRLDELNRRYGTDYRKWEEVAQPKPKFGALNVSRVWHDFQDYRMWSIEQTFDEMFRLVRRLDSRPLILYYGGSLHHSAHQLSVYDIGLRLLKKYGGMLDITCFEDPVPAEIGSGFVRGYGVPLMAEAWQVPPPAQDFRRMFFQIFELGVQSYQMVGDFEKMAATGEGAAMGGTSKQAPGQGAKPAPSRAEFMRAGEAFRRAAEFRPVRAAVAGLFSYRSIQSHIPARNYINPTLALIPKLQERQYSLDWRSDLSPLDDLGRYPALLDANSEVLERAVIERLGRYVEEGGRLALLERSGRYALEDGRPEYPLLKRLKCPRPESGQMETWALGKGQVLRLGSAADWTTQEGTRRLLEIMEWLGVERPITAEPGTLAAVSRGEGAEFQVALHWPRDEGKVARWAIRAGMVPAGAYTATDVMEPGGKEFTLESGAMERGVEVSFGPHELKVFRLRPAGGRR
ncbi:MAG: beta-galactosidase, partial [Acidobacteria bacterium]|nr:beta-galactosidase [Acidobacteriota bacterium]